MFSQGVIVAPASATGGAIAIIRVSGEGSIALCDKVFRGRKPLSEAATHTLHYGNIVDGDRVIDDVLVSVFHAPHSYTGEQSVEISTHGSRYIVSTIISLICRQGARLAEPGEFSARAFAAGRIDLSQAEAVADIIAADSQAAHIIASTQMRGGYSDTLNNLRGKLIELTSLLELELDFGEEDVVFADRSRLQQMLRATIDVVSQLKNSFHTGNAIRNGVGVAIIGAPNVGKSTLLNRLVGEQRAMVSDIAGTTRDTIEESVVIDGIRFRFIDTAGIRTTDDTLERMGIERTIAAVKKAQIVVSIAEPTGGFERVELTENQTLIRVVNKADTTQERNFTDAIYISARENTGIDTLQNALRKTVDTTAAYRGEAVVSNLRHYEALNAAYTALTSAQTALANNISTELLTEDIRVAINHIGEITGSITSDTILQSIFSSFCIGK
ncbi:MAG: tRNA uridine-5-carboxymethylaminomethyl(34) synthesis GTPase MnmE [Rikenellaceae bacterium]|nr:tRNA uridine-5-carboxymethylaminomethyl(34) synthesis GTPase MnmE [Rikenellaceae bacterium]